MLVEGDAALPAGTVPLEEDAAWLGAVVSTLTTEETGNLGTKSSGIVGGHFPYTPIGHHSFPNHFDNEMMP